jgi:hypothetical protein
MGRLYFDIPCSTFDIPFLIFPMMNYEQGMSNVEVPMTHEYWVTHVPFFRIKRKSCGCGAAFAGKKRRIGTTRTPLASLREKNSLYRPGHD